MADWFNFERIRWQKLINQPRSQFPESLFSASLARNIVSWQVLVDISRFSPWVINLSCNRNIYCGLKKVAAKRNARVYFGQQILALSLVFHHSQYNSSCNKCARTLANQPVSTLLLLNPRQMVLLFVKLNTHMVKNDKIGQNRVICFWLFLLRHMNLQFMRCVNALERIKICFLLSRALGSKLRLCPCIPVHRESNHCTPLTVFLSSRTFV